MWSVMLMWFWGFWWFVMVMWFWWFMVVFYCFMMVFFRLWLHIATGALIILATS